MDRINIVSIIAFRGKKFGGQRKFNLNGKTKGTCRSTSYQDIYRIIPNAEIKQSMQRLEKALLYENGLLPIRE